VPVSFSSPPTDRRPPAIVFVGALDYRANLDGLAWFCRHVWPEVRRRLPEATFRLVGSRPGPAARRIGRIEGVELVGEVPDVRPYLADATVVVAPLRVARGIQNKVLEALAMQKAVVASPQALEGLAVEPGEHLLSADTPEAWVNSIIDLFQRPDLGARLAAAGRRYVEEHYDWNLQLNRLASLPGLCDLLPRVNGQPVKSPAGARG
jgi:glycosyltransferase involved in cell wall biosynthesis